MTSTEKNAKAGEIWAVGGGKGATGKSFLTAGLGTVLAREGRPVILVDMDAGRTGLASLFGLGRTDRSLTAFFKTGADLSALAVPTGIPSLSLITGRLSGPASEGILSSGRQRFFRRLAELDARNVIIDLGPGSHGLALDTFLVAERMIIVLSPESGAVENVYHFIKSALFRRVKECLKEYGLKEIVPHLWGRRERYGIRNIKDLIDYIKDAYPHFGTVLDRELLPFRIHLVLNMVRTEADLRFGTAYQSALTKYLGVPVCFSGPVADDDSIRTRVRERKSSPENFLPVRTAREIETLAENIAQGRDFAKEKKPA